MHPLTNYKLLDDVFSELSRGLKIQQVVAFRIDTSGAATVRNALLERLCRRKEKQVLLVSMNNRMPYEC